MLFRFTIKRLRRLTELSRTSYAASRTFPGNSLIFAPVNTFIDRGTLARAPFSGGEPRPMLENVRFADWTPDGSDLAVIVETTKG